MNLPQDRSEYVAILKEITILQQSPPSPNLVKMMEAYITEEHLLIILEYCAIGSLEAVIQQNGPFSELQTAATVKQILYALLVLHNGKTIHRDIKPANILIDQNGLFKLADFGLAAVLTQTLGNAHSLCGMLKFVLACGPKGISFESKSCSISLTQPSSHLFQNNIRHSLLCLTRGLFAATI